MIESAADVLGKGRVADSLCPVEQQIVVIENVLPLLFLNVDRKEFTKFRGPCRAPREVISQNIFDLHLGIDATGVDSEAGPLRGEAVFRMREAEFMPDDIHEIGQVLAIMNRERWVDPNLVSIIAQQTRTDAVESAGPRQGLSHDAALLTHDLRGNALNPALHFGGGAP